MKITTKFDIYQRAWVVWDNQVMNIVLDKINVSVDPKMNENISYQSVDLRKNEWIPERKLFHTKEELLKSL